MLWPEGKWGLTSVTSSLWLSTYSTIGTDGFLLSLDQQLATRVYGWGNVAVKTINGIVPHEDRGLRMGQFGTSGN